MIFAQVDVSQVLGESDAAGHLATVPNPQQEAGSDPGSLLCGEAAPQTDRTSVSITQQRMRLCHLLFIYLYSIWVFSHFADFLSEIEVGSVPPGKARWAKGRAEPTACVCVCV